jgi:hypothetical protein
VDHVDFGVAYHGFFDRPSQRGVSRRGPVDTDDDPGRTDRCSPTAEARAEAIALAEGKHHRRDRCDTEHDEFVTIRNACHSRVSCVTLVALDAAARSARPDPTDPSWIGWWSPKRLQPFLPLGAT